MKLEILGAGCRKCKELEKNARAAAKKLDPVAVVEKVTDMDAIVDMGVMVTPALVVDGEVKSVGKVLSEAEIISIIQHS